MGFEWLGFSQYVSALDQAGLIPELDLVFDVTGTELKSLKLEELLRWAYAPYVLKREPVQPAS